ncbi:hypothetical protein H4R99_004790, partial [Coemansia sp. RSA 1722]
MSHRGTANNALPTDTGNSNESVHGSDYAGVVDFGGQQVSDLALRLEPRTGTGSIRPLRSWSSSEKHAPSLDENQIRMMRGMRRFSVAGPASNSGSTAGSRKSHTLLSLPTWAEEEDEAGSENSPRVFGNPMLMRVGCVAAAGDQNRSQTAPPQQTKQASHSGELNGNGSSGGGVQNQRRSQHGSISNGSTHSVGGGGAQAAFAKRIIPEATFSFLDMASSCSSSGAGSIQHNSSARGNQHRLRTPYSISIPSMIGSPLSFTQSFLASRTSMYGRQPPSSQIRAAHIDWDSLSAMDEAGAWGGGGGGNSNRDLPLWQQGLPASIDPATGKGTHPTLPKDAAGAYYRGTGARLAFPEISGLAGAAGSNPMTIQQQYRFYQQQQQRLLYQQYMWQRLQSQQQQQQQQPTLNQSQPRKHLS